MLLHFSKSKCMTFLCSCWVPDMWMQRHQGHLVVQLQLGRFTLRGSGLLAADYLCHSSTQPTENTFLHVYIRSLCYARHTKQDWGNESREYESQLTVFPWQTLRMLRKTQEGKYILFTLQSSLDETWKITLRGTGTIWISILWKKT